MPNLGSQSFGQMLMDIAFSLRLATINRAPQPSDPFNLIHYACYLTIIGIMCPRFWQLAPIIAFHVRSLIFE